MQKNKERGWLIFVLAGIAAALTGLAVLTIWVDPFFHYHKPVRSLQYDLGSSETARYICDGIVRNFDYDAIITGTSMTENFKTSDLEDLFQLKAVKVPYSGAYYNEIDKLLQRAFQSHKDVKLVIRSLDLSYLIADKDISELLTSPGYLLNDRWLDDVYYVFNKDVLLGHTLGTLDFTKSGGQTPTFDEYVFWGSAAAYGSDIVLWKTALGKPAETEKIFTQKDKELITGNLRQNVIQTAKQHPDTEFYLFMPPYSICYWESLNNYKRLDYMLEAQRLTIEELLPYPNIKVFSFFNNFELICDLDNYTDMEHYGEWVNTDILKWMKSGEYQLTKENYERYLEEISSFYKNYDYSELKVRREKLQ